MHCKRRGSEKSACLADFLGGLISQDRLLYEFQYGSGDPLHVVKSPILTNTPCKSTCLYNSPVLRTVDFHKLQL